MRCEEVDGAPGYPHFGACSALLLEQRSHVHNVHGVSSKSHHVEPARGAATVHWQSGKTAGIATTNRLIARAGLASHNDGTWAAMAGHKESSRRSRADVETIGKAEYAGSSKS